MSHWSKWGGLALFAVTALGAAGCDTDAKTFIADTDAELVQPRFRFVGRVIDKETGGGVQATVNVVGMGAGQAGSDGFFQFDCVGAFESQFGGTRPFQIRIEDGGAHAARELIAFLENDETDPSTPNGDEGSVEANLNDIRVVEVGTVVLRIGRRLTAIVTKDGLPLGPSTTNLRGATVLAYLSDTFFGDDDTFAASGAVAIIGVTNQDGVALLENLDPLEEYTVIVPAQNLDGQGGYDFGTGGDEHTIQDDGDVLAINVTPLPLGPSPNLLTNNTSVFSPLSTGTFAFTTGPINNTNTAFFQEEIGGRGLDNIGDEFTGNFNRFIVTADGSVRVIFVTPVDVLTAGSGTTGLEPHFYFRNNLRNEQTPAGFNEVLTIAATATRFDPSLGTVWTFTPATPLQANEIFGLRFFARSTTDSFNVANFEITGLYRPVVGNATIDVALDNYNGSIGGTGTVGVTRTGVFLEFAEPVRGTYKVLRVRDTGRAFNPLADDTTFPAGSPVRSIGTTTSSTFSGGGQDFLGFNVVAAAGDTPNDHDLGATQGARYRVRLFDPSGGQINLSDNGAGGATREVTLIISVQDADEPERSPSRLTFDQVITLPVR